MEVSLFAKIYMKKGQVCIQNNPAQFVLFTYNFYSLLIIAMKEH